MFTGIIEEIGKVGGITGSGPWARLTIQADRVLEGTRPGDSIAVNGACLTVVDLGPHSFTAEVMYQTLDSTNVGELRPGAAVNLERALPLGGRLGGHLVAGHVDGVGRIVASRELGIATVLEIQAPAEVVRYIAPKGSVAVDGVSLTVTAKIPGGFSISLIPHTRQQTTLGRRQVGEKVNIEVDMVARYVAELLPQPAKTGGLTLELLEKYGYS